MTHSCVWRDSSICGTWLIHMWDMTHSFVCHDSFICVTRLIHMCDMTQSYVWRDSFMCVTRLIHVCGITPVMTRWCAWHDPIMWHGSFVCENMTHLYVQWLIRVTWLITWLIHMCDMTHDVTLSCAHAGGTSRRSRWTIQKVLSTWQHSSTRSQSFRYSIGFKVHCPGSRVEGWGI